MVDLSGKIALVTGASKGLGAAIAKAYADAGAHVLLLARHERRLGRISDAIQKYGGQATIIPCDLSDSESLKNLAPLIQQKFGQLDIFVGNAGLLGTLSPLQDITTEEFNQVLSVNLTANFILLKTLPPLLNASKAGRIVMVSTSDKVINGQGYWGSYAVSKAALETLVKTYADENAHGSIRTNIIKPGALRTDMRAKAKPGEDPQSLPLPEEITYKFLELASNDCTLNGQIIEAQPLRR